MDETLIINADDFGWTDGHNQAVEQAHCHGVLNRASLMTNAPAFWEAVNLAKRLTDLQVGVHLTLNEGKPLQPVKYLPNLTKEDGCFYDTLSPLLVLWAQRRLRSETVRVEWRSQIERALLAGIPITHLDSHKHVHMIPPFLDLIIQLAQEYHVSYVRLPLESLSEMIVRGPGGILLWLLARRARPHFEEARIACAERFVGIGCSGSLTSKRLIKALQKVSDISVEIMVHPAIITPAVARLQRKYRWAARYRFEEELAALCDPKASYYAGRRVRC